MIRLLPITIALVASPLQAQSPIAEVLCAPSSQLEAKLKGQFGTTRRATGLRNPEEVVEVWTSQNGDWTLVIAYASGRSCIVAMGEHWAETALQNPA